MLFTFPPNAAFGRTLPKSKIYEHARPSRALRELFVQQVDQIIWQYKLAPETINIKQTPAVAEIQIFHITLKTGEIKETVLNSIDQAIPFPILFELHYAEQVKALAAFKRPSAADSAKWVVGDYFASPWLTNKTERSPLPVTINLERLYAHLLTPLLPWAARTGEGLQPWVERMERIRLQQREIAKCEARLRKEKQFNHKVTINAELRTLQQELEKLTAATTAA